MKKTKKKAATSKRAAVATVLVLRTCAADLTSFAGRFQWPESGPVAAPDWSPRKECGNGLHGFLWGEGSGDLASWEADAKWLVVEVEADSIVDLSGKVKFPRGIVVYCGDRLGATEYIAKHGAAGKAIVGGTATAGHRGTATAGDCGTATAGDSGTATAGHGGEIRIRFYDSRADRYRTVIGFIGEDGLKPGVPYVLCDGKFVEKK